MSERAASSERRPFVRQLLVRDFRSIKLCKLSFGPLTVLVGRNGAGKSNILDALSFLNDSLRTTLDAALVARGGVEAVRRRSPTHPRGFAIQVALALPDGTDATYGIEVAARDKGGFTVTSEKLQRADAFFHVDRDDRGRELRFEASRANMPPGMADRLYLVTASGFPEFRPVYDGLLALGFYSFDPTRMRDPQTPDAGELLEFDGRNIASVIARLERDAPDTMRRVVEYMSKIVPGVHDVKQVAHGAWETIEFHQDVEGADEPWPFEARSMSDGTLRAVGALVAVMQRFQGRSPVQVVGIEEPETALHPAAVAALTDALHEAANHTQIILTCHSPDVLDHIDPDRDTLLVVQASQGVTTVACADPASREMMKEHLRTPGELLRMDLLAQDPEALVLEGQASLFEDPS